MLVGHKIDMPATPTIAPVGATPRHVRLTAKAGRAIAAIAGLHANLSAIVKLTSHIFRASNLIRPALAHLRENQACICE
jgi:hypothetical protein